ncbi:hypothetical protein ACFO3O_10480 [Dokdonia ponticola]|uniref:DUF4347 domain-containing protein n=1 Tax=Dokdonia ponticola TaxID=2041041 RepID=A0ABV9HVZ9_9FLAO
MITPILLSKTDAAQASADFDDALKNEPATLILVIGDNDQTKDALENLSTSINSDDHFYKGVRAVHAPNVTFILDTLKGLHVSPRLEDIDWNAIDTYVIFSISNVFNNIGNAVLSSKYDNRSTYYIEKSIMLAMAYDKDLNQ